MDTISSADLQRHLGLYADRALSAPVMVTRNGRERLVLLSATEFHRLRRLDRMSLYATELSNEDLSAIAAARPPADCNDLDDEPSR